MASGTCINVPEAPNGEPSKMYQELQKTIKDRLQVNWIYSCYLASNAHDAMKQAVDANGKPLYKENSQGEFNAKDVMKFIDYASMQKEMSDIALSELQLGSVDSNGNRVNFSSAKEALEKADLFNDTHKGLVATVVKHGKDIYNILVSEKSSRTHMQPTEIKEKLKIWDVYKQAFNGIGVDIENMHPDAATIINANNADIAQSMKNLQNTNFNWLYYDGAITLLSMDLNSPQVQRFINSIGSLEDAAQAIDDINHGVGSYSQAQIRLAMNAVAQAQQMQGLDLQALQQQVTAMSLQVKNNSFEDTVALTLHQLKKKYNIEINEINLIGKEIKTLSRAAAEAALQIERRIRELEKQQGNYAEGKRLEGVLNQLLLELNSKKYYSGVLNFLGEAQTVQTKVQDMINDILQIPQTFTGTELEKAFQQARILEDIKQVKAQYYPVIEALASGDLTIDESINQTDIDNLTNTAKSLKEFFNKEEKILNDLSENVMQKLLENIIGDTAPDGQIISNVIRMAQADSSWLQCRQGF